MTKDELIYYSEINKFFNYGAFYDWTNTLRSDHMYKLAEDIFFWIGGKYIDNSLENVEKIEPLGKHWMMLNPDNYWGGYTKIRGTDRVDLNHFGRHK